jgi:hypothetical protein
MKAYTYILISLLGFVLVSCNSKEADPVSNTEEYRTLLLKECSQRIELSELQGELNEKVALKVQTYRDELQTLSSAQKSELQKKLLWGKIEDRNQDLYNDLTRKALEANKVKIAEFEHDIKNKLRDEMQISSLDEALAATRASLKKFDLNDPLLKAVWQEEHSARSEASLAEMGASLRKSRY